jgi:trehalose synthase
MKTAGLHEVEVQAVDAERLEPLIGVERMRQFERAAEATRQALAGGSVWNVNSTGAGGGVAEMLQTLLAYTRCAGVDARWLVIEGDPDFFAITKRIHNGLYGSPGDGGELGPTERSHFERTLRGNTDGLLELIRPGDVVVVHDPQPAALLAAAKGAGARVVWRCHVGLDRPNEWSERAWEFLRPYLIDADAIVVSRGAFAPPWADPTRVHVIRPRSTLSRRRTSRSRRRTPGGLSRMSGCSAGRPSPSLSCSSAAATGLAGGSAGAPMCFRPARRYRPTRRSSYRSRAGTG